MDIYANKEKPDKGTADHDWPKAICLLLSRLQSRYKASKKRQEKKTQLYFFVVYNGNNRQWQYQIEVATLLKSVLQGFTVAQLCHTLSKNALSEGKRAEGVFIFCHDCI